MTAAFKINKSRSGRPSVSQIRRILYEGKEDPVFPARNRFQSYLAAVSAVLSNKKEGDEKT